MMFGINTNLRIDFINAYNHEKASQQQNKKTAPKRSGFICIISPCSGYIYFTLSTIALKATGWYIAKSAKTLRLISMLLFFNNPIN